MAGFDDTREELAAWRNRTGQVRHAPPPPARGSSAAGGCRAQLQEFEEAAQSLDAAVPVSGSRSTSSPARWTLRRLPDRHPILLFPLRLETRFKMVDGQAQLWVRAYPDQCLAESFEPASRRRKRATHRPSGPTCGGPAASKRTSKLHGATWRTRHGVGRASWIVKPSPPLRAADQPRRDKLTDVVLVIISNTDAPAKSAEFWEAVWRDGGNQAAVVAARPALEAEVGPVTAARIVDEFMPMNIGQPPGAGRNATNGVKVAVVKFTPLADLALRRTSWSRAPQVRLLPERLVLMAWRGAALEIEEAGQTIKTPLDVGPDPAGPATSS